MAMQKYKVLEKGMRHGADINNKIIRWVIAEERKLVSNPRRAASVSIWTSKSVTSTEDPGRRSSGSSVSDSVSVQSLCALPCCRGTEKCLEGLDLGMEQRVSWNGSNRKKVATHWAAGGSGPASGFYEPDESPGIFLFSHDLETV